MANTVTTEFPLNEIFNFIALITILGDGSGELVNQAVVNASSLTNSPAKFDIETIDFELNGFTANLMWGATVNTVCCALPNYDGFINFKQAGQARHNDAGAGITGNLLMNTFGLQAGACGTIIIKGYHR